MDTNVGFTPLGNRVLLQRDEADGEQVTTSGLVIPAMAQERPQTATVVAVGPGLTTENGTLVPTTVRNGDRVMLGKYSGYDVTVGTNVYTILNETDILGVLHAGG